MVTMTKLANTPQTRSYSNLNTCRAALTALLAIAVAGCDGNRDMSAKKGDALGGASASMAADPDVRTTVMLPAQGRHMVLEEMRGMLISVEGYVAAAAKDDTAGMRAAAHASGAAAARDMDPAMEDRLPAEFLRLGMSTHAAWDSLASDVGRGATPDQSLGRLAIIMKHCVSCHAQYRIEIQR